MESLEQTTGNGVTEDETAPLTTTPSSPPVEKQPTEETVKGPEPEPEAEAEPVAEVEPEPMDIDTVEQQAAPEETNAPVNGNVDSPVSTDLLGGEIAGATPGKHEESQYKCVYPPSDSTQSLIVEHFGFLPIAFIDEIINAANDTIYRATDALSKFVEKEQGSSEATNQAVNKAETLLEHAVDKNFDKFELYALRNLFNIPQGLEDYIVLPHRRSDVDKSTVVDADDEAELDKELKEVRQQLVAQNLLKAKLQKDISWAQREVRKLRSLNEQLHMKDIAQRTLGGMSAQEVVAGMRRHMEEIVGLTGNLTSTLEEGGLDSIDNSLSEPAARDIYLTKLSQLQISDWESRMATTTATAQEH